MLSYYYYYFLHSFSLDTFIVVFIIIVLNNILSFISFLLPFNLRLLLFPFIINLIHYKKTHFCTKESHDQCLLNDLEIVHNHFRS